MISRGTEKDGLQGLLVEIEVWVGKVGGEETKAEGTVDFCLRGVEIGSPLQQSPKWVAWARAGELPLVELAATVPGTKVVLFTIGPSLS